MPVLKKDQLSIDFTDNGQGDPVILVHSSISGNRQWHALIEALQDRYRVLAVNLFGYGETTPWSGNKPQTLADQAGLIEAVCEITDRPVHLVGHSFGGIVAMKAAQLLGDKIFGLVLLEPNPFYLLAQNGRKGAYDEIMSLCNLVKHYGGLGDWVEVAMRFADYWVGEGTWEMMSPNRRTAFLAALPNNFYEWDTMSETTTLSDWQTLSAKTLVVYAAKTKRPIREIVQLLAGACPHWSFVELSSGGHMAPLTRPDLVNPIISEYLDSLAVG